MNRMTASLPQRGDHLSTATATAAAASVFALVFLGLLIYNGYLHYGVGLEQETQLTALKRELLQDAENTALIDKIRVLDLTVRRRTLRSLHFTSQSGLGLLLCALIAILAFKWKGSLMDLNPNPTTQQDETEPIKRRDLSRWVVAGVAVLIVVVVMSLPRGPGPAEDPLAPRVDMAQTTTASVTPVSKPNFAKPEELMKNWHRFRGWAGAGVTTWTDIPNAWNGAEGKNIKWKSPVALPGHNSPVVWQDKVFLSGANEEQRVVYCYNAADGKLLWTGEVPTTLNEEVEVMEDTGLAACSLATDGVRVYSIYATGDLAAFDFAGKRLWYKNLGLPESAYGYASSLEVWQDKVLVQYDQAYAEDGKSRMFAFAGATGEVAWQAKRPVANSWTSPIVAKLGDTYQLVAVGDPWTIGYQPETGKEIWRAECVGGDVAASPIVAGKVIVAIEPYSQSVGVRWDGQGDVTKTHKLWVNEDAGPDIPTPVSDGQYVYLQDTQGLLICVDANDGKMLWEYDFEETVQASPSLVNGKLYVLDENGVMYIGTPNAEGFTLDKKNELGEKCFATPAFMPGRIYIRSHEHLICIAQETGN